MSGVVSPGRRRFLTAGAATVGVAASGQLLLAGTARAAQTPLPAGVFSLGVASGDPLPDGVVLWTRLAPDPLHGGGMPDRAVVVEWQISEDSRFRRKVRRGYAWARPELGHSVHADVRGLLPDRHYWYRFRTSGQLSPVGRTRTAPRQLVSGSHLRLALASCQNWQHGYFTAVRRHARPGPGRRRLRRRLHLRVDVRGHRASVSTRAAASRSASSQYRNRYAQYRSDPHLKAMHAAAPFVVTFDDHEVDNDFAGDVPQDPDKQTPEAFAARLTAAYQAYYEHMPVRATAVPNGPHIRMHRRLDFGRLVRLNVLDTRQYRSDQATSQAGAQDPAMTMLGAAQKQWLLSSLRGSEARWNLIASQIMMAETDLRIGDGKLWYYDAWDGYQAERNALLGEFAKVRNPVVLSGDRHVTMISDLKRDFADPRSAVVGSEFVGTSISSGGDQDPVAFHKQWDPLKGDNPHWKVIDNHRGYHLFDIRRAGIDAQVRIADTVTRPTSASRTLAKLHVEAGKPGVRQV